MGGVTTRDVPAVHQPRTGVGATAKGRSAYGRRLLALIAVFVIVALAGLVWHGSSLAGYEKRLYSGASNQPLLPHLCLLIEDVNVTSPQFGEYWSFWYFAVDEAGNKISGKEELLVKQVIGLPGDRIEFRDVSGRVDVWRTIIIRNGEIIPEAEWVWALNAPTRPKDPIVVHEGQVLLFPRNRQFIEGMYLVSLSDLRGRVVMHIP